MNKRPLSVTILSLLIIAAGAVGLAYHLTEFKPQHPLQNGAVWVLLLRVSAIVGGVFMFRGNNWARWLTLAWIALHVVISVFRSLGEVAAHALLLAVFAYFLLRAPAAHYFRNPPTEAA
jgi:hypothetical protein